MKKFRKLKIGIISLVLMLVSVVTMYSFRAGAAGETITYRYEAYSKEEYDAVMNATLIDAYGDEYTIDEVQELLDTYPTLSGNKKKNWLIVTNDFTTKGEDGPERGSTSDEVYAALVAEIAEIKSRLKPITTAVTPGQELVVLVYAQFNNSSAIRGASVCLNIADYADTSAGYTAYPSPEIAKGASPNNPSASLPKIGFLYGADQSDLFPSGEVMIGGIGFKTSETISSLDIGFISKDNNNSTQTNFTTAAGDKVNSTRGQTAAQARFDEVKLELEVSAPSSDTSLIELTVEGVDALGGGSVTGASAHTSYVGTEISDGTANVFARVNKNGTVVSAVYSSQLSDVNKATPTGTNAPVSGGSFSVPMSSVSAGQSMYAAFQVNASDGTPAWYIVELPKAKDSNCDLEGAVFKGTKDGSPITLNYQNNITPNFATTTTFTVIVPKGTTGITFTPTFTSPKTACISPNSTYNAVSGTAVSITGSSVTITVKAQNEDTKAYSFTLLEADTRPTKVTSTCTVNGSTKTSNDTDSDNDKVYDITVPAGQRSFLLDVLLPTGAQVKTMKQGGTTSTVNWNGSSKNVALTETDDSKAVSENIEIVVSNNGIDETYTIHVTRAAASDSHAFSITDTKYFADAADTTGTAYSTSSSGTKYTNASNFPYGTLRAEFKIVPTDSKTIIMIDNVDQSSQLQSKNLSTSSTKTTVTFTVKSELDQIKGSAGTTYTLELNTAQPENTPTSIDLKLLKTSDSTVLDTTYAPTYSNFKYTYYLPVDIVGTTFKMQISTPGYSNAKIYVTTTSPASASSLTDSDKYNSANSYPIGTTTTPTVRYVSVVGQNGGIKTFEVDVYAAKEKENRIKDIRIFDPETGNNLFTFSESTYSYANTPTGGTGVHFPYSVKTITYEVTLYSTKEDLTTTGSLTGGSGTVTRTYTLDITSKNQIQARATAEDGTQGYQYTIDVTRDAAKQGDLIDTLSIYGVDCKVSNPTHFTSPFVSTNNTTPFTIIFGRSELLTSNDINITVSDGAVFDITNIATSTNTANSPYPYTLPINGGEKFTITVRVVSEKSRIDNDGNSRTYTINIIRGDSDKSVNLLDIIDDQFGSSTKDVNGSTFNFNSSTSTQTKFVVPYKQESVYINTQPQSTYSTVVYSVNGGAYQASPKINLTAGSTTSVKVRIISEVGTLIESDPSKVSSDYYVEYTLPIERKDCSHDNELTSLIVSIGGVDQTFVIPASGFNSQVFSYAIDQLATGSNTAIFKYIKKSSSSTVSISSQKDPSESGNQGQISRTFTLSASAKTVTFAVDVACECDILNHTDAHTNHYEVELTTERKTADTTAEIVDIQAYIGLDSAAADHLYRLPSGGAFDPAVTDYEVKLSSDKTDSYVRFVVDWSSDLSTLYYVVDGGTPVTTKNGSSLKTFPNLTVGYGETKTVEFYVKAEDPTIQSDTYTITVTRDAEPNHTLTLLDLKVNDGSTDLAVPGFNPTDEGGAYTVYVGDATTAYIKATKGHSTQSINNPHDATNPLTLVEGNNLVKVIVTAEDTDTKDYLITIVKDAPKTLEDLEVWVDSTQKTLNPNFSKTQTSYKVSLSYAEDHARIAYTATTTDSSKVKVELIDKDGNVVPGDTFTNIPTGKNTYKVRVTAKPSEKYNEYSIEFDRAAGQASAEITTYEYYKTNDDRDNSVLTNLADITSGVFSYSYIIARDNTVYNPKITVSNNGTWRIKSINGQTLGGTAQTGTLNSGQKNTVVIEVKPEDTTATPVDYTFYVYPCNDVIDFDNIKALVAQNGTPTLDKDGTSFIDYANGVLTITVPYNTNNTWLEVLAKGYNAKVYNAATNSVYTNGLQTLKIGDNTFNFYIKSEYGIASNDPAGQSPTVTVKIVREDVSHNADLEKLIVSYIDPEGNPVTVEHKNLPNTSILEVVLPKGVTNVSISATPKDSKATVTGASKEGTAHAVTIPTTGGVDTVNVVCTAEDIVLTQDPTYMADHPGFKGTTKTYPVAISYEELPLDEDNSVTYIIVKDSEGNVYLDQAKFDPATTSYGTYKIPFAANDYTVSVVKIKGSKSTTYIGTDLILPIPSSTLTTKITSDMRGKTVTVTVYCEAEKGGVRGPEYFIDLQFEEGSSDAKLKELLADGVMVPGFDPSDEGGEYNVGARPYEIEEIEFTYKTNSEKVKSVDGAGVRQLKPGDNVFTIRVTAEDNSYREYIIHVKRDYPLPYLTDLDVIGEMLLNANEKETTFDKETYTYNVIVPYTTFSATINTTVDNEDYTVAANNCTVLVNTGLVRTFTKELVVGSNPISFTVSSLEGKSVEYKLNIQRRDKSSANANAASIEILQIPEFKDAYSNLVREYAYVVPNGIRNLDVIVHPEKTSDAKGDGATYEIINDKDLKVGHNTLVILIFAEDQVTTKAVLVDVERLPMSYTVDDKAYDYTCTKLTGQNAYEIDLVDKRADAIEDYTKYIVFPDGEGDPYDKTNKYSEKPIVTVVSDLTDENCREVVLRIFDGDQEEFVTLKLKSSALTNGMSIPELLRTIIPWILLVIAIIILIIILICVNRDKFGAINKKRKKRRRLGEMRNDTNIRKGLISNW